MPDASGRNVVVVDGSNLATEGRTTPSLRQLDEAVKAYALEDPEAEIVVVVDASFEHRIDPSERQELVDAELHGEVVSPPAGAIGRGDAFVLRIAERTGARVLSNDSFQEFHAEHPWLFDEGRLVGGKPVPGVGWIFTPRIPVRGPKSRQVTGKKRRGGDSLSPPVKAAELARAAKKVAARKLPAALPDGTTPKVGDVWPARTPSAANGGTPTGSAAQADIGDGGRSAGGTRVPESARPGSSELAKGAAGPDENPRAARANGATTKKRKAARADESSTTAAQKAPAKKAAAKKAAAKKAAAKKAPTEKAAAKKVPAKKAPGKKVGAKKAAAKKAAAAEVDASSAAAEAAALEMAGEQAAPSKAAVKKRAVKKRAVKSAARAGEPAAAGEDGGAEELAPAKGVAKRAASTRAAGEKAVAEEVPAGLLTEEGASKKAASKRAAAKKTAPTPAAGTRATGVTTKSAAKKATAGGPSVADAARTAAREDPVVKQAIVQATAEALSPAPVAVEGLVAAPQVASRKPDGKVERSKEKRGKGSTRDRDVEKEEKRGRRRLPTALPAVNEPLAFIHFVATYPLQSEIDGEVVSFTSHGAMVDVDLPDGGQLHCYIPLSAMGDPPPTKARQVLTKGERRSFVLVGLDPPRRVAELALPGVLART